MIKGFWSKLPKPFFVLAPMADVTDRAFRQIIAEYGRRGKRGGGPDVFWTEFVSADGLASKGREKLLTDLKFSEKERPIVAQLFGARSVNMREAAKIVADLGFDGIDINMGCPDRAIEKQGAGAAHIKNPKLAREIIQAAIDGGDGLPVSVKTRIGYNKDEIEKWIRDLLKEDISAITIHARTRKELSKAPANWEKIGKAAELIKNSGKEILLIGNGDVISLEDGRIKAKESGADGVMLGRAIFGNPWLFDSDKKSEDISTEEKLLAMVEHTRLFEKLLGKVKNFAIMKKHYRAYANGFDGAKELRIKLMRAQNCKEVADIVSDFLK
ncbi:MAG: tRNA-dihydrouridine synthase [Patescibacteria group bacterium]|nr:tRNA-dihydrouridine synthase [Patescibacteria group bacterium]MDE1988405.1 tRNA-dihydrouridine synthase [Patescibacteria group bacterium]MDE2217857.1 tRNA-dihydrouridine synthase [Patescibacteria group bacterium]